MTVFIENYLTQKESRMMKEREANAKNQKLRHANHSEHKKIKTRL